MSTHTVLQPLLSIAMNVRFILRTGIFEFDSSRLRPIASIKLMLLRLQLLVNSFSSFQLFTDWSRRSRRGRNFSWKKLRQSRRWNNWKRTSLYKKTPIARYADIDVHAHSCSRRVVQVIAQCAAFLLLTGIILLLQSVFYSRYNKYSVMQFWAWWFHVVCSFCLLDVK